MYAVAPLARLNVATNCGTPLADAQKQIILGTLKYCGGDKRLAARTLGVSLKTLYNRLGAYGTEDALDDDGTAPRDDA